MANGQWQLSMSLLILIPIFNDWEAAGLLLKRLDGVMQASGLRPEVLLVDDGSTLEAPADFLGGGFAAIDRIQVLELACNLGHQRAITTALVWIHQQARQAPIVIMDGDGEDKPEDVPRLLKRFHELEGRQIVFAERARRSETWQFKVFYRLYRIVHGILTGHRVRVGNFSVLPRSALRRLVVISEMWNHYAASVLRAKLPHALVPAARGARLQGRSRMNFVSLVTHGLSAISVYGEIVGTRLLVMACMSILLALGAVGAAMSVAFLSEKVVPWWLVFSLGALAVLALQSGTLAATFSFLTLGSRHHATFLPVRDCGNFVHRVKEVGRRRGDKPAGEPPQEQAVSVLADDETTDGEAASQAPAVLLAGRPGPFAPVARPTGHRE